MKKIYLVEAYGGEYDDAWRTVVRACESEEGAHAAIAQYLQWQEELKGTEYPEACELYNFDEEDDRQIEIYEERRAEFERQLMIEMGIPEFDHEWMIDLFKGGGYGYDFKGYLVNDTVLV